jgi:transketolase
MFAGKNKLSNLTAIVDRNNIQIGGFTEDVMPLEPLVAKYVAFNWTAIEVDGHSFEALVNSINNAKSNHDKPTVIICNTIAGKGISFMENKPEWHGKVPDQRELEKALDELKTLSGRI